MSTLSTTDTGSLARRLREDAGLGVRGLADALGVTHSAVARAERGDPALASLAERAVEHLLKRHTGSPVAASHSTVGEEQAPYSAYGGPAAAHLQRLLDVERGWRRALVRGVLSEHGLTVKAEGAAATVRVRSGDDELVLRFDLDRGVIVIGGRRYRPIVTSPFERADRESWGEALELLAAFYAPKPNAGWAKLKRGQEFTPLLWAVTDGDDVSDDDVDPT